MNPSESSEPVIVNRHHTVELPHLEAEHIVVAWDGSAESEAALDMAAGLAARDGARLKVVTVVVPHPDAKSGALYATDTAGDMRAHAKKSLADLQEQLPIDVETELREGDAAGELLDAAADADLIVVGSRGHGGFARVLLGSVSSELSARAPCPVVVVPRSAAERVQEQAHHIASGSEE